MNEMENIEIMEEVVTEEPTTDTYDLIEVDSTEESEDGTFGRGMLIGSLLTAAVVGATALVKKVVIPKLKVRKAQKLVESQSEESCEDDEVVRTTCEEHDDDAEPEIEVKIIDRKKKK